MIGKFSGLHLLATMYTAFRQIDPTMDTGADVSAEYQAALQMQKPKRTDHRRGFMSMGLDTGSIAGALLGTAEGMVDDIS